MLKPGFRSLKLLLLLSLSSVLGSAQQPLNSTLVRTDAAPQQSPSAVWSRVFPELTVSTRPVASAVALSVGDHCAAIAGGGKVQVFDIGGQGLWTWEYSDINKFITPGALAVSPGCDEIAMPGDSGYKYTWIAGRNGRKTAIPTTSTPLGIAFSHEGEMIALGTGGCDLLLIGKSGEVKWKKVLHDGFCVLQKLSFSADDRFILLQGNTGVVRIDGSLVWMGSGLGMSAARDLQTFVSWWVPNHGHATGSVTVLDEMGKTMWQRVGPGVSAAISASGDRIAAPVYAKQNLTPDEWENIEEQPVELQVLSRRGELLSLLPFDQVDLLAMSPAGDRMLLRVTRKLGDHFEIAIEEIDVEGKSLLSIPDRQVGYSTVLVAGDFSGALILTRSPELQLQWFKLK